MAKRERLVEVSTRGAPASDGPGAGERWEFGRGAGGGMIVTERGVLACLPPAWGGSRPLCAANGPFPATALSLAGFTETATSSLRPAPPWNTTLVTPASFAPRSLSLPPFLTRPPDMHDDTHFTVLIFGV